MSSVACTELLEQCLSYWVCGQVLKWRNVQEGDAIMKKVSVDFTVIDEDNMTEFLHLRFLSFCSEMELWWGWIATDTLLKLQFFKSYAWVTRLGVLRNRKFGTAFFAVYKSFFFVLSLCSLINGLWCIHRRVCSRYEQKLTILWGNMIHRFCYTTCNGRLKYRIQKNVNVQRFRRWY
jgi:hypothetical protein